VNLMKSSLVESHNVQIYPRADWDRNEIINLRRQTMKTIQRVLFVGLLLIVGLMALYAPSVSASPTTQVYPGDSIQAKVDATAAGGSVIVHDGIYHQSVVLNKSLTFRGDGAVLDGTLPADPGTPLLDHGIIIAAGTSNVVIEGIEIRSCQGNGICAWNQGTSGIILRGNNIHDCKGAGIQAGNRGEGYHDSWRITNNEVFNNLGRYGIDLRNARNSVISQNTVTQPAGTSAGIYVAAWNGVSSAPVAATAVNVSYNTVRGSAIYLKADRESSGGEAVLENVRVIGNQVLGSGWDGIWAGSPAGAYREVRSVIVRGNDIRESAGGGIVLHNVRDASVVENTVKKNGGAGVFLNSVPDSNVRCNVASGNDSGIRLAGPDSRSNKILENTCNNNTNFGISLVMGASNNLVRDNDAFNNGAFDLFQEANCNGNVWKYNDFGTTSGI